MTQLNDGKTTERATILACVEHVGGSAIAKPIDGHAGFGVARLTGTDGNIFALIDTSHL